MYTTHQTYSNYSRIRKFGEIKNLTFYHIVYIDKDFLSYPACEGTEFTISFRNNPSKLPVEFRMLPLLIESSMTTDVVRTISSLSTSVYTLGERAWIKDDLFQGMHVCEAPFRHLACFLNHLCCNGRDVSTAPSRAHCVLPGTVSLFRGICCRI